MPSPAEQLRLEEENTKLDVMRHLRTIWRRRLFVILPVMFITSLTFVGVRFMSPLYASRSKIHVEKRARVNRELERQIVDENKANGRVRMKDEIANIRNQVSSRDFLEGIIRELGMHNDPDILARAQLLHETRTPDVPTEEIAMRTLIRGLRQKLSIKNGGANTFQLSVFDNDPDNAYLLAKVITRSFVDEVKRERMEKLSELFKFSSRQSQIYQDRLDEAERELRDFQTSLLRDRGQGSPVTSTNYMQAKSYHHRMTLDADAATQRVENLRVLLAQVFDPLPNVEGLRHDHQVREIMRRLLADAEENLLLELERLSSSARQPIDAETLVDGTQRSALRMRLERLVDMRFEKVDSFYRGKIVEYAFEKMMAEIDRSKAASLQRKMERYQELLAVEPEVDLQLKALEQKVAAARRSLETFQSTVQSAELSETIMATQLAGGVNIVDPPEKPVSPLRPNKRRLVALALLLSMVGGILSIFAVEYLDKSFKEIQEIERITDLHVIGTLPRVAGGLQFGQMPVNRKRRWLLVSSFALLILMLGSMALYERLLRKQRVAVPAAAAEAILRREEEDNGTTPAQPGPTTGSEDTAPAAELETVPQFN